MLPDGGLVNDLDVNGNALATYFARYSISAVVMMLLSSIMLESSESEFELVCPLLSSVSAGTCVDSISKNCNGNVSGTAFLKSKMSASGAGACSTCMFPCWHPAKRAKRSCIFWRAVTDAVAANAEAVDECPAFEAADTGDVAALADAADAVDAADAAD